MAETMQKLNIMGQVPHQNNGQQIVNVTFGHNGSGKLYSYYGTNKRTGDIVTPEVTHPKSGKTYKTLGVVRSTHKLPQGQDTVNYLNNKNIGLKTLGKTDQKSLPGYHQGWEKDAQAAYDLRVQTQLRDDISPLEKLTLFGDIRRMRK